MAQNQAGSAKAIVIAEELAGLEDRIVRLVDIFAFDEQVLLKAKRREP